MDLNKKPRRRVANFTTYEKALLAQLIRRRPIILSKLTDGKSVAKKQAAWSAITQEFNSDANVQQRETITLKRAWDNMKAFTRKTYVTDRNSERESTEKQNNMTLEVFQEDSDFFTPEIIEDQTNSRDILDHESNVTFNHENTDETLHEPDVTDTAKSEHEEKPTDYVRQVAGARLKHFENKKKMELQILQAQLEVQQIQKRTADLKEKEELESSLIKRRILLLEEEKAKIELEKSKLELEKAKLK